MKKVLALVLALVLVLSLVACGGSGENKNDSTVKAEMSLDDMLDVAQDTSIRKMGNDFAMNTTKAKEEYFNNAYKIWGVIYDIGDGYVDIRPSEDFYDDPVYVYLPNEELKKLNKGDVIQVVGIITDDTEDSFQVIDPTGSPKTITLKIFVMENAHFLTDIYKIKDANISDITYDRTTMKYTCEVEDENFDKIYVKSGQVSDEQWKNCEKYTLSASGKIKFEEVYNFEVWPVMNTNDTELSKK